MTQSDNILRLMFFPAALRKHSNYLLQNIFSTDKPLIMHLCLKYSLLHKISAQIFGLWCFGFVFVFFNFICDIISGHAELLILATL